MTSRITRLLRAARPLFEALLVFVACVGSGSLQCGRASLTVAERRGAMHYQRMCSVCHGPSGGGYRADEATMLNNPVFLATATDSYLRRAISQGRKGTVMSAWHASHGGPLSYADVSDVVAFLRTWQRVPSEVLDERPLNGVEARGQKLYDTNCLSCHGVRGIGGRFVNIGEAGLLSTASNGFLRLAIRHGRPGTVMPAFGEQLGDQQIDDLVALLRSWEPKDRPIPQPEIVRASPLPLGPVPLNPRGPEPKGFKAHPERTSMHVVRPELKRGAKMALLDARAPSDYIFEHIPGAVSVPFYDVERYAKDLPKDAWLVCYCSCPHAESGMLCAALAGKGFKKVTVLDEGLRGWNIAKWETRKGEAP
jgi:cytochrome c oxidase cbb3-type subunit III